MAGDFDIEFNYDRIQWEFGEDSGGTTDCLGGSTARVGFSNGKRMLDKTYEFEGSAIKGAFIDSNLATG